jgi:transmembrane sensor
MNTGDDIRLDPVDGLAKRIAYLINGYNLKNLTQAENRELDDWVTANMKNQQLFEELTDPANLKKWIDIMQKLDPDAALERVNRRIFSEKETVIKWPYWMAAAVLIGGMIFLGSRLFNRNSTQPTPQVALVHDLGPGGKHAVLTLGNGTIILLDTLKAGKFTVGNGAEAIKDSTNLSYQINGDFAKAKEPMYNTLRTPAGGEFQVVLSDGTRVWLNALSSLRYPESFSDSVRKVELKGEGYFEVAKDAAHPFIVTTGGDEVRVLGTHFDINAYSENKETIVTLAEGSVRLNRTKTLKPGEKGTIDQAGKIKIGDADLESALAWKDGQFIFKMTPLPEVMKQTANWYDAKIIYQDNITEHFNARIPRDVPVSKLLHLLEATDQVHFKIEDRTITVMK